MKNTTTKFNSPIKKLALDNAAKIYPAAKSKNWNAVFGVSAYLYEKVNVLALEKAVLDLQPRFPSYYVKLKQEFFWDMFVPATDLDIVKMDRDCACKPFDLKSNRPLFRVVYSDKEIRVEFFHSVTDGTGGIEFTKALLVQYFKNCDTPILNTTGIKTIEESYSKEEIRDDFQTIYEKGVRQSRNDENAYQVKLEKEDNFLSRTEICIPIDQLKKVSKGVYNCTVTQYVATVYALALLEQYKKDSNQTKPVILSIPVNLRKFFKSQTLRNFSSYVTINVTPTKNYTFENVLALIKKGMREKITKQNLFAGVCQNVADEKMPIAKFSPNAIKKIVMHNAFYLYGERKFTSTVTSIGYEKLPQDMENKIAYLSATLGETPTNKINCAVCGYKNTLCVNISTVSMNTEVQDYFINHIKCHGIDVKVSEECIKTQGIAQSLVG